MARPQGHRDEHGRDVPLTCPSRRHEPGRAPLLASGLGVCPLCRDLTEQALVDLPELFDMCALGLDLRPTEPPERVVGHRPRGTVRDGGVSVQASILGVLAAWSDLVTVERAVTGPDDLAVRKLVRFLAVHVHWLCKHPGAADFVDEVISLAAAADEAVRSETGFRVAVGRCPHLRCDRTVYSEAHRQGAEPYEFSCEAGHVWAPQHWLDLRGGNDGPRHN